MYKTDIYVKIVTSWSCKVATVGAPDHPKGHKVPPGGLGSPKCLNMVILFMKYALILFCSNFVG